MTTNNIYRIHALVNTDGLTLKSVYIPSIHRDYDVSTICYVFQTLFGTVCRIDRVEKTKVEPVFQSMFIYYYENGQNACDHQNRVYPAKHVQSRQFLRKSPVGPNEYWVILPNKKMFPDTTLTLDEISQRFDKMEVDLGEDLKSQRKETEQIDQDTLDEHAILSENREYLRELRYAQNTPNSYYLDTTVNIHQLAQNLQLMEERYVYNKEKNFRFEIGGTTLFVENIPLEFGEPELWEHFAELHPGVMGAKVCKHPKTKESMGFGYVCFDEGFDLSEIKSTFKVSIVV